MKRLALALVLFGGACTVPDKFFTDGGTGDDTIDGGADLDAAEDTVAPETAIDSGPPALSNAASFEIAFSANEDATFVCSLDGSTPADCDSPFGASVTDGPHTFSVRATDLAGNADDTPAEHAWQVDTAAPQTSFVSVPPLVDNSTAVTFVFGADESATFECALDPAGFGPCNDDMRHMLVGLTDGTETFRVRAIDLAGNVDLTPSVHTWTIDTSTPDTVIDSGPTGSVANANVAFTYSSPDAGAGATFECQMDNLGFFSCPTSGQSYGGLSETTHTFEVRVRDAGGNLDPSPASRTFTVDLTAPTTTIVSSPSGTVASQTATFMFSSNEPGATFECQLDGGSFAACPATHQITGLSQGSHTLNVRAVDLAGTPDATPAQRMWTVDTVGPVVTFVNPTPAENGTSGPYVTIAWTLSEGTPSCELDGASYSPCTSPQTMSLREATHQFRVSATDGAGNPGASTRNWTVDCTQPALPGGAIQLHMDETGTTQTLTNALSASTPGVLGTTSQVETVDPTRTAAGRFGAGLAYSIAEDDVATWDNPAGTFFTGTWTFEVWVYPVPSLGAPQDILVSGDNRFAFFQAPNTTVVQLQMKVTDDAGVSTYLSSGNTTANVWHHLVGTFSSNTARFYLDGVLTDTRTVTSTSLFSIDVLRIGTQNTNNGLGATLDEVNVSATAATGTDVLNRWCPP